MTPEERARKCLDDFVLVTDKNLDEIIAAAIREAELFGRQDALFRVANICQEWVTGYEKSADAARKDAETEFDAQRNRFLLGREMMERAKADVLVWLSRYALKTGL